ncbi:MAG TPA: hypothetical protein VGK48_05145 [Terriglobia bacterium]|jgi:hypothetical protein
MRVLRRSGAIAVLLFLLSGVTSAVQTLPQQLSDAAFWKLIEDESEATQPFPGENYVSNEPKYAAAVRSLKQSVMPGGVFLGVGPEQNFNYIAAQRPKLAFVVDIRRQNLIEQLMYKALFDIADDRADFVSRLFSRKRPDGLETASTARELMDAYGTAPESQPAYEENLAAIRRNLSQKHNFHLSGEDNAELEQVFKIFARAGAQTNYHSPVRPNAYMPSYAALMTTADEDGNGVSYLATEESYRFVRDLERHNLIVPLVGDFAGAKTLRSIGSYLKQYDATVRVFYLSNVESYLWAGSGPNAPSAAIRLAAPNGGWKTFFANVAALPLDSSSTFIRYRGATGDAHFASIQKNLAAMKSGLVKTLDDLY